MLLIYPASKLGIEKIKYGLSEFNGNKITVIFGSVDPSINDANELAKTDETARLRTFILEGVDHNFSGESLETFINAPVLYLFD